MELFDGGSFGRGRIVDVDWIEQLGWITEGRLSSSITGAGIITASSIGSENDAAQSTRMLRRKS